MSSVGYLQALLHDDPLPVLEPVGQVDDVEPLALDAVGDPRVHEELLRGADVVAGRGRLGGRGGRQQAPPRAAPRRVRAAEGRPAGREGS